MFAKTLGAALAAGLLFCTGAAHAAPIEAYGRLPSLTEITLSQSGQRIAYVRSTEASRYLVVQTVGVKQPLAVLNIHDTKLRDLRWVDNKFLLITSSTTTLPRELIGSPGEYYNAQAFDVETQDLHDLFNNVRGAGDAWYGREVMNIVNGPMHTRIVDGHPVVFVPGVYFETRLGRTGLFKADLTTGDTYLVSPIDTRYHKRWVIDEQGKIVAEARYSESDKRWRLRLFSNDQSATPVDVEAPIDGPSIQGLSEDGSAIVIASPEAGGEYTYQQISLKDGSSAPWKHEDEDFGSLLIDNRTGRLSGGIRYRDKTEYVFFDPKIDRVWRSINAAFKTAADIDIISHSSDWNVVVVRVFGPDHGYSYFSIDMALHKADPIGPVHDGIDQASPVKWIAYEAADKKTIPAYLTLPQGREAKGLPLIVLPHGGPHARDYPGFDWLTQGLASRGYAVLQPQFRGSAGFGKKFMDAGYGEFGRKMQTDLSDGVRMLAKEGVIDPKRVCIVGASYGGYAALAGATLDTGVYRCAVSVAGISDVKAHLKNMHSPINDVDRRGERFWDRFLGVSDVNDPKLDAISPLKHISKISIPIMLIHGLDDTVVPITQSRDMADALKAADKPFEFVRLEGEDHWLSRSETRQQMLENTVRFLEKHNPPG